MEKDKLKKLSDMLKLLERDTISPNDLANVLAKLVKVVNDTKANFNTLSAENIQKIQDAIIQIDIQHSKVLQGVNRETLQARADFEANIIEAKNLLATIKKIKATPGRDGKDGQPAYVPIKGIDYFDGLAGKDGSPDTRVQIVEKINTGKKKDLKIEIGQIETDKLEKSISDRALSILDQRTKFLINKGVKHDATLSGEGTDASPLTVIGGGGGGTWGSITGTLSNQTDLQTALDAKADDATTLAGYGISDTKANFNTALSDGNFLYVGDVTSFAWGTSVSGTTADGLTLTAGSGASADTTGLVVNINNTTTDRTYGARINVGTSYSTTGLQVKGNFGYGIQLWQNIVDNTDQAALILGTGVAFGIRFRINANGTVAQTPLVSDVTVTSATFYQMTIGASRGAGAIGLNLAMNNTQANVNSAEVVDIGTSTNTQGLLIKGTGSTTGGDVGTGKNHLTLWANINSSVVKVLSVGSETAFAEKLSILASGDITTVGNVSIGGNASAPTLRLLEPSASGTNYTQFTTVAQAANITYTLPATVGGAGTFLKDVAGDGVLSWAAPAGSGITRTQVTTSGSLTLAEVASTDYIYYVAGAHTLSMPSPNNNRYTIKNNHSAAITVDTTGAELIEGGASISVLPGNSVDIASDTTNWYIV